MTRHISTSLPPQTVTGTYTTSWGRTRSNVNATFMPSDTAGVTPLGINSSLNYPPGTQISFTFKQILDLAGIDLDAPNELNDGGLGPPWPRYRITGIELAVDMVYQNYVEKLLPFPDPFNFQDTLQAKARGPVAGVGRGLAPCLLSIRFRAEATGVFGRRRR